MQRIVVFHPGAIGDVILATPVAIALNYYFPKSRIIYWTHESLCELLTFCDAIDKVVPYDRSAGILSQISTLRGLEPDLVVNLSGSFAGRLIAFLSGVKALNYRKEKHSSNKHIHAVENFVNTLSCLKVEGGRPDFPTLDPSEGCLSAVREKLHLTDAVSGFSRQQISLDVDSRPGKSAPKKLVGLVFGVGKFRPHRAWTGEGWKNLANRLIGTGEFIPVLVGGTDEEAAGAELAESIGASCQSLAGRLSLAETAGLLKLCSFVVAGDTGPAHIAVAVGTPVIGLYGATFPERSGPYGYSDLLVDKSELCSCHHLKKCGINGVVGPGDCMRQISCDEVWDKINTALNHQGKDSI